MSIILLALSTSETHLGGGSPLDWPVGLVTGYFLDS